MAIQRDFILRYRAAGHIRFQVPAAICVQPIASSLQDRIQALAGVKRAHLYVSQHKLAIRFDEERCSFMHLAKQLFNLLAAMEHEGQLQEPKPVAVVPEQWRQRIRHKVQELKASRWLKTKYSDAKETVQAAKVLTKMGMKRPNAFMRDPEKAVIDFLNDILVLYLIKIHWKRVTQIWLPNPFKYRYEWLAVFYLFFLLMRSRRPRT